jgi:hypothetical protein
MGMVWGEPVEYAHPSLKVTKFVIPCDYPHLGLNCVITVLYPKFNTYYHPGYFKDTRLARLQGSHLDIVFHIGWSCAIVMTTC